MKKFLSMLLALTMVMSLVVVPARAANELTVTGLSLSAKVDGSAVSSVASGTSVTFTVEGTATVKEGETLVSDAAATYSWTVDGKTESGAASSSSLTKELTTTDASKSITVSCTVTYNKDTDKSGSQTVSKTITVTNAQAAFEAAVKGSKVTFNGRTYTISNNTAVSIDKFNSETIGDSLSIKVTGYPNATLTKSGNTWTAKSDNTESAKSVTVSITEKEIKSPTVSVKADGQAVSANGTVNAVTGQKVVLTADYSNKARGNASYQWTNGSSSASSSSTYNFSATSIGDYNISVKVSEGTAVDVATHSFTINVTRDYLEGRASGGTTTKTLLADGTWTIDTPYLYNTNTRDTITLTTSGSSKNCDIAWTSSNTQVATVSSSGVVTAGNRTGTATITAKITYNTKEYTVTYTVTVTALDTTLDAVENGDYDSYYQSSFESTLANVIDDVYDNSFSRSNVTSVKLYGTPSNVTLKDGSTVFKDGSSINDGFTLYAAAGFIGDASFQVKVNNSYVVTLYVPVTSAGTDIKASVTGASSSSSVSFDVDDVTSGKYLYIKGSGSKTSFSPSALSDTTNGYDGTWGGSAPSGWERFDDDDTITIPANKFTNGKVTLYVVSVDSDYVATVGTVEVSQKSYTIEYNVVAGESVTFDQDDFEDLFKEYAEDNGDQTTRKNQDYPYVEYSHVELSSSALPAAKTEGDLYYGSTALTSKNIKNEEFDDMDKMSFTAISKIKKDTVTIPVTLVGKTYTSASSKGKDVSYNVSVVINVVKEDIKYTVGVNDSVTFDAKDFADYLNDYQTSYKKSTLDYVEFSLGRNSIVGYTSGALYQSYSTYYAGELAESSDKFYYDPSRKQLDLDDVTYVTTKWAEAGKTVYIPFTVYGTKNEKAEGTVAIEIKNAMNYTDVVQGRDYFYDSVQWAVNNEITKGTTTTTFSPLLGCTRAQIVTFLWRAAGSPEPTSSKNPFKDVNSVTHADYYKAILWAVSKGITDGTTATTFSPDATCTRAQIVTFLYRYANSPATSGSLSFKDVSKTTHSAYYNAILWAVNKNITTGNGNNTFAPEQTCNRAEAVTFLYRYFN